jgi:hypothetical protein
VGPSYYDTQWGHFSRGVDVVDRLLDYLNKHYGRRKHAEGNKDVMTVKNVRPESFRMRGPTIYGHQLALCSWKENVLESLAPRLGGTGKACLEETQNILAAEEPKAEKSPQDMRFLEQPLCGRETLWELVGTSLSALNT